MEKSLFALAETVVTHALWGICHGKDEISLSQHRERVEKKLQKLTLPTPIASSIKKCLYLLEKGLNDAFVWIKIYERKIESFRNNEVAIFHNKNYLISNHITLLGEFDDATWVNRYVDDEDQNIFDRFYFACFYCLEDKIQPLWREAQNKHLSREIQNWVRYTRKPPLVKFWLPYADVNNLTESINIDVDNISLALSIVEIVLQNGHEKALHYFLDKFPESIRLFMAMIFCHSVIFKERISTRYPKNIHYIFSTMDTANQKHFLQKDLDRNGCISIWNYYLHPQLISLIPSEIERFQSELPETAYAHFLMKLVLKMTKIKSALYQEAFQAIWRIGSAQNKRCFLEHYRGVLWILVRSKDFTCSRCVLKDASLEERKRFLFESMEEFLIENVSFRSDPHAIRSYLLLFLTDLQENSLVPKPTSFHSDSLNVLNEIHEKLRSKECSQVEPVLKNLILEIRNFF